MTRDCDAETCPMWAGDERCICTALGLDRDNLPTSGTFVIDSATTVRHDATSRGVARHDDE